MTPTFSCGHPKTEANSVSQGGNSSRGPKKLTDADVLAIRSSPDKRAYLAVYYGVSEGTIWAVRTRRTWKDLA